MTATLTMTGIGTGTGTGWVGLGQDRVESDGKGSERAGRRGWNSEGLTMDGHCDIGSTMIDWDCRDKRPDEPAVRKRRPYAYSDAQCLD